MTISNNDPSKDSRAPVNLMRLPEVMGAVGIRGKATIYRWIKAGIFPKPVALGPRLRAWRRADIEHYLATLKPDDD